MHIVEEQIVDKIRTLSDNEQEDVLLYVNGVINGHSKKPTLGEKLAAIFEDVSDEEWEKLPTDGAEQHDHYIYGTPKR